MNGSGTMRHCLLFCSLILIFSFSVQAFEKIVKQSIVFRGKTRTFYLFVPDNVTPARAAPLLVMLHGSGRNGLSLVEKWKDLASKQGIILVGPDAVDSNVWSPSEDDPDFLKDLVEYLKSRISRSIHGASICLATPAGLFMPSRFRCWNRNTLPLRRFTPEPGVKRANIK